MSLSKTLKKAKLNLRGVIKGHLKEIKEGLDKGYNKKDIYTYFKTEGLTNSSYQYFIEILNQVLKGNTQQKKKPSNRFHIEDIDDKEFE